VGTSRNDASPRTPAWRIALAVIGAPEVGVSRQNAEIWRAAVADRGERLFKDFANPVLAAACRDVAGGVPVSDAIARYDRAALHQADAGLALEIGRRALARCTSRKADAAAFAADLFAEAVSYYASRDLPSFVAAQGRVPDTSRVIQLKNSLREATREQIKALGDPGLTLGEWRAHVKRALRSLQSEG